MATSAERNKAYRARHKDDPEFRRKERERVRAWRQHNPGSWRRYAAGRGAHAYLDEAAPAPPPGGYLVAPQRHREAWED